MTKTQILKQIRELVKPYLSLDMPQSTFSYTLTQIEKGLAKPITEAKFFNRFGYHKVKEAEYEINEFPPK